MNFHIKFPVKIKKHSLRDKYIIISNNINYPIYINTTGYKIINQINLGYNIKNIITNLADDFNIGYEIIQEDILDFLNGDRIKEIIGTGNPDERKNMIKFFKAKENFIHTAEVELTTECNLKCKYCTRNANESDIYSMNMEEFKNKFKYFKSIGLTYVTITGGEPTIAKKFQEKSEFLLNNFKCELLTNGINIEPLKGVSGKFERIRVSLDSLNENNNDFMRGRFRFVIKNIKKLEKYSKGVIIAATVSSVNYKDIEGLASWCLENNYYLNLGMMTTGGRGSNCKEYVVSQEKYKKLLENDLIKNATGRPINTDSESYCRIFDGIGAISPDGSLRPCAEAYDFFESIDPELIDKSEKPSLNNIIEIVNKYNEREINNDCLDDLNDYFRELCNRCVLANKIITDRLSTS